MFVELLHLFGDLQLAYPIHQNLPSENRHIHHHLYYLQLHAVAVDFAAAAAVVVVVPVFVLLQCVMRMRVLYMVS